jgi:hypothetical protein
MTWRTIFSRLLHMGRAFSIHSLRSLPLLFPAPKPFALVLTWPSSWTKTSHSVHRTIHDPERMFLPTDFHLWPRLSDQDLIHFRKATLCIPDL